MANNLDHLMRAMVLDKSKTPLRLAEIEVPHPKENEILVKVHTCGVCRTDLHVVDGELPDPKLPLIPGHQIVGTVEKLGQSVQNIQIGERVGIPWLGSSCGQCLFCKNGEENLCDYAVCTGYQKDGGFAEYCVCNAAFCFPIPEVYTDIQAAPLLCAGLIGYRALRMTDNRKKVGFYGFGASAHILIQVACYQGREVFAFTRKGDIKAQTLAKSLGAAWIGDSQQQPPVPLDAAIIFAPVGSLVPLTLKAVRKGGIVVCAGIQMSDIPSFPYSLLWGERIVCSVANLTRQDGREFLALAPKIPVKTTTTSYPLEKANEALADLRAGSFSGSAVIVI